MLTGKVTGVEYARNKDGSKPVLILQLEVTDPDDIRGVQLDTLAGVDSNPPNDSRAVVLDLGGYQVAVAIDDQVAKTADQGESEIYSSGSGVKLARVKCDKAGNIELNGGSDFAVKFSALETAFNQLKADFDAHTHGGVTTGAGFTIQPAAASTADISGAKVDSVKIP